MGRKTKRSKAQLAAFAAMKLKLAQMKRLKKLGLWKQQAEDTSGVRIMKMKFCNKTI